jgi:hypothetical protein
MRLWNVILVLILVTGVLVGCGGEADAPEGDVASMDSNPNPDSALDASYEGALPVSSQLALGIFELEETENAVTAEQAETLLPLWQALQGGSLQSEAETSAVLKQIEGAMIAEQLAAIAAMQLTFEDMGAWMRERGVESGLAPEAMATRQAAGEWQGPFGNISQEERAAMMATRQAGGEGGFGPGGFGQMSEEEREAMRATAEASGIVAPGGRGAGRGIVGTGQLAALAELVVEMLTGRVAE